MKKVAGIVERGTIAEAGPDGYTVASFDRDGIVTPPLMPMIEGQTYAAGDKVYYFVFGDGTGKILCGF